jgi:hypothetical protein
VIISFIGIAIALLITYWWSNAGAFSAFIHFLCVVTAGAVAFGVWEPASYAMMGGDAGGYAKGLVLLGTFVAVLVVLRLFTDRFIPMNLTLPRAADLVLGGAFGAGSGVLTVGILTIGIGFVQSTVTIFDYTGWSRRSDVPTAPTIGSDDAYILGVAEATAGFYGYLSWGAYTPWLGGGTINTHMPQLVRTSGALYRDSFDEGMGKVAIPPSAVSKIELLDVPPVPLTGGVGAAPKAAWAVKFDVSQEGFDGAGQQFVLSASQARVIGDGKSGRAVPVHPLAWMQEVKGVGMRPFFFNSPTSYATSVESKGDGSFVLLFPKDDLKGQAPRFFEIKGVRFRLPTSAKSAADLLAGGAGSSSAKQVADEDATNINPLIDFPDPKYSIGNTVINTNAAGSLELDKDNFIIGGEQKFPRNTTASVGSDLRVRGFKVSEGERLLRLDATAQSDGVRIFPDLNSWVRDSGPTAQGARVAVIDESGSKYYAVGLVEDDGEWVLVKSMRGRPLTLKDIPIQAVGSGKKLSLHFRVPTKTKIVGLVLATSAEDRVVNTATITSPDEN